MHRFGTKLHPWLDPNLYSLQRLFSTVKPFVRSPALVRVPTKKVLADDQIYKPGALITSTGVIQLPVPWQSSTQKATFEELSRKFTIGEQVQAEAVKGIRAGVTVIVRDKLGKTYEGVVYRSELYEAVKQGEHKTAYVLRIREDGRIICSFRKYGHLKNGDGVRSLTKYLNQHGEIPLGFKSDPIAIQRLLGLSKVIFKNAVGMMYKRRLILTPEPHRIALINTTNISALNKKKLLSSKLKSSTIDKSWMPPMLDVMMDKRMAKNH